jgi:hypothetical protein
VAVCVGVVGVDDGDGGDGGDGGTESGVAATELSSTDSGAAVLGTAGAADPDAKHPVSSRTTPSPAVVPERTLLVVTRLCCAIALGGAHQTRRRTLTTLPMIVAWSPSMGA